MAGLTTDWAAAEMQRRGYAVRHGAPAMLTGGSADTRTIEPGQLFTAFRGENVDGNEFVADAIARGAAAVICERAPAKAGDATVIVVPDAVRAVGELGQAWLRHCKPRVIGITGSAGKTTTTTLTGEIMKRAGHTLSILKKENGTWLLARDANMLAPEGNG